MKEAIYYKKSDNKTVVCELCPHFCKIQEGKTGNCKVRKNKDGNLYAETYQWLSAVHYDPIEKKPLYHFRPGRSVLSIGSVGCNLHCKFCQNSGISQSSVYQYQDFLSNYTVDSVVETAMQHAGNIGIAYTYNEPTVYYEFMYDIAIAAKEKGLDNVVVTNGFINPEPLEKLTDYVDAFAVDLKGFNDNFYSRYTGSQLEPVKEALKIIRSKNKHIEITNLVIPTLNDDEDEFEQMLDWIVKELGENTVLHLSKYFPYYKMDLPPTPLETLLTLFEHARKRLNYVYLGNVGFVDKGRNTHCHKCNHLLITRNGYATEVQGLDGNGNCEKCGTKIMTE